MSTDRSGYQSLSDLVLRAMPATPRLPPSLPLREASALLLAEVWPDHVRDDAADDAMVNVAALAVAAGAELQVLLLQPMAAAAVAMIATTWPRPIERLPALFAGPWVAEAAAWQQGGSLFGETWSLGSYGIGEGRWLVGLAGGGARVEAWSPALPGRPAEWARTGAFVAGTIDYAGHARWAGEAVAWAVALGEAIERGTIKLGMQKRVPVAAGCVAVVRGYDLPGASPPPARPKPAKPGKVLDRRKKRP